MVNNTVEKNITSSDSTPDKGSVKHSKKGKAEVSSSTSSNSETPPCSSGVPSEKDDDKTDLGGEQVGSRAMAEVPTKTSLFCSVPLNKIRSVLSNAGGKTDEEENSSKFTQISRKLLCLYCDRTFVSSNLRQKHVERCHSEKQSRRLSSRKLQSQFTTTACFHCDKLPVEHSLRQLFEHLISAHSQKYFGCLLCEERFLNQIQLNDHNTKLHNSSKKQQQKLRAVSANEGLEDVDQANRTSNSTTEENKDKVQKSSKNKVKKKKEADNPKPPPRQLRNKKKVSIKASKVGLKRSARLQSTRNKVPVRKKRTKTVEPSKSQESNTKTTEKAKSTSVNPYPEFDSYYRVKKITDHSIDNLKISSLTFDDVFDKAFFNRIKCNIQENLLHHLDGKLFKNEESESRISNFEKNPPTQEVSNTSSENFGCDLSLNAITPVTSILTANFGEDLESQIEYGSKPSKKKVQIRQDPVRHKYVTRRKYQASILEHKENRDLSKLDMWTQLVIKDRQQKELNGKKSAKEMLEYTTCDEYKLKIQRNELNRILDRRGPFEDLKEEASTKAALEQLNSESSNEISEECFKEVRSLMEDLLNEIVKNCSEDEEESINVAKLNDRSEYLVKEDIPELPDYLKLRRTSLVPSEEEIDKSDKIVLICSSQETENYELPTNTVRHKNEMVELSGEWARSRIYVCAACGLKVSNMKFLIDHKSVYHQNSWVQHYELVGNQTELYRHLCIPGLGKVGHIEETVPCKSWLKSESRVCTKCGKVCNSLSELHRHILECGGDWTWMLARKKCKYRPFGARKKRRGLVKRIRVSNQKTDQTEKKKYKKRFEGPRQRPSDADTIQRMLANLPPKRSSRKSICMKDGLSRKRQKSPQNKKQVMKCGKIVRHKSTYNTNPETTKNPNHKNTSARQTLRTISRTLSSKILDTNSKLKVKRQLIQNINRRSPRKNSLQSSETPEQTGKNEETKGKVQNNVKTVNSNVKDKKKADMDKVKSILKEKVNIKSFFPVSKRKTSKNKKTKVSDNLNSDSCQDGQKIKLNKISNPAEDKPSNNVMKIIKKTLNFNKKAKTTPKNDPNLGANSEPIVVIEKLPQVHQTKGQTSPSSASKKAPNKRKLRSSFRKVIDKVKKLKLDNNTASVPNDRNKEINIKPVNSFLGQGAKEKEKLATVLVPLVEESKEMPLSNLAFVQNAMDNNSPTEESLIPENIFNLQHNSEDLLQAKSPMENLTNEVRKNEVHKYLSTMSARIFHIQEAEDEFSEKIVEVQIKNETITTTKNKVDLFKVKNEDQNEMQNQNMSLLSIETSTKSDKSPLISPLSSPSLLSPKMKGKLRKPNRGLNDCIAMLTKKAFEETNKPEIVSDSVESIEKPTCLDNTIEAHKIIRPNECILKIPVIESQSQIQSEVLDLSKPKRNIEPASACQRNNVDLPSSRSTSLWNPVNNILCNNQTSSVEDSKIIWPVSSSQLPNTTINPSMEKAILKIPKFGEISRSNNVDNIIQGVIENYDEPVTKPEKQPYLKVPSVGQLNSVDEIIEDVVKGNLILPSSEENSTSKIKSVDKKSTVKEEKIIAVNITSRTKKATKKNKQARKSLTKNNKSMNPPNSSLQPSGLSESFNKLDVEVESVNVSELIATSSKSAVASDEIESGYTVGVDLSESVTSEKSQKDEEMGSPVLLDETKTLSNSEIVDVNTLNVVAVSMTPGEKIDVNICQEKIETTEKSISNKDNMMIEEKTKIEKNDAEVTIENSVEISSFMQIEEPAISKDEQIPLNDEKIISGSDDFSLIKPPISDVLPNSVAITESSKSSGEDSSIHNHSEEPLKEKLSIEDNENEERKKKNVLMLSCSSTAVEENKSEVFVERNSTERNFNSNATDSEDELPLLLLKSRSRKHSSKQNLEALEESEITVEKEANILESEEVKSGENGGETEEMRNACASNISTEFPSVVENEKLIFSDSSSNKKLSESIPSNATNKRKSTRINTSGESTNRRGKNTKKTNKGEKSRHSSKSENIKILDETLKKEEVLGNISNTFEIMNSAEYPSDLAEKEKFNDVSKEKSSEHSAPVTTEVLKKPELVQCCEDNSDTEVFKNIPMKEQVTLKTSSTVEAPNKPKNFLVDSSICNFKNNITNSNISPSKPAKIKKKNKNKQDSIKTKLIFKFPKIILKEPILRIPPRDSISENMTGSPPKTGISQDEGIKLILDNPFSNTKVPEEKFSSTLTIPETLEKSPTKEVPSKTKSSNKKKQKHKKRLLKSLAKAGSISEFTNNAFQNATLQEAKAPIISDKPADGKDISEVEDSQSLPDHSILSSAQQQTTDISFGSLSGSEQQISPSEVTFKLPITLKLQANSLKKFKLKNFKRKKDKVKRIVPDPDTNHVDSKNGNEHSDTKESNISSSENTSTESTEIKEFSPYQPPTNSGNVEESSIPKHENNTEETGMNKSMYTSTPEISPEIFVSKPQLDQDKLLEDVSDSSQLSTSSSAEKIDGENEVLTPIKKSGRSLRSTVKITYKQSNIFALQIEDKEISDLKIIEKPKIPEVQNVSSNDMQSVLLTDHIINEEIPSKEISDQVSVEPEWTVASNRKRSNSKKVKAASQIKNVDESLSTMSNQILNIKEFGEYEDAESHKDSLKAQGIEKEVRIKSKKSRKSKTKNLEINSTLVTESTHVESILNDSIDIENECLLSTNNEKEIIEETLDVLKKNEPDQQTIEEKHADALISSESKMFLETHEDEQLDEPVLSTTGKYEDSSFSEGELVINESFESVDSIGLEEHSDDDKKLEIITPEAINLMPDNIQTYPVSTFNKVEVNELEKSRKSSDNNKDLEIVSPEVVNLMHDDIPRNHLSTSNVVEEHKSQKSKKHKKERSLKSQKKSNSSNYNLKIIEPHSNISVAEVNEIPSSESGEKMQMVEGMDNWPKTDSKQKDITEDCPIISLDKKLAHETRDEFEFEEDLEPLENLKSKFKSKKIKDIVEKSIPHCEEKAEKTSMTLSPDLNTPSPLDVNNGRRQRSAKSKALENINTIEKKLDQILDTKLANSEKAYLPAKNKIKVAKHKEIVTENKIPENDTKGRIFETSEYDSFCEINGLTTQRKSRAAKAKALENIKVSEIKANDIEEGNEMVKKTNIPDSNEKVKRPHRSKEKKSSKVEHFKKNLLNFQDHTNITQETLAIEENNEVSTKISPLSSGLFSSLIDECSLSVRKVHQPSENKIAEVNPIPANLDLQCEISKGKKNLDVDQIVENDSVFKDKNGSFPFVEKNKMNFFNSNKEKNIEAKCTIEIYRKDDTNYFTDSTSPTNTYPKETSDGRNSKTYQKRKRSDNLSEEFVKKTNEINCYDIDKNSESKCFSFSPSKKKKKPIKNEKRVLIDDINRTFLDALKVEVHNEKSTITEVKNLEHISGVSKGTYMLETEQIDSLDVTLKATADEISSILMEDKHTNEIPYPAVGNDLEEKVLSESGKSGCDKNNAGKDLQSSQKLHGSLEKTLKNTRNKDGNGKSHSTDSEKASMMEEDATSESGSRRRSRRACKVNTYNENFLAEAVFGQPTSDNTDKKSADDNTNPSIPTAIQIPTSDEVLPEKKLNSEELFDLLKTTAPDNLIALKPVEENPSDTPHTDDNFDDEFDDILRKSQALFGEKPYKKLDDICRSEDSSSTSKLTDFEKLDDNTETKANSEKSVQSYITETTFSNSIISGSKNETMKSEELTNCQSDDLYCEICKKKFKRIDNLIKHRTTLTHIAKLSEMEAKEAQNKSMSEIPSMEESKSSSDISADSNRPTGSSSFSYPSNAGNNALKIAEIITEALEKPGAHSNGVFSEGMTPLLEYRRYKSLGERKSFEYDQGSPNIPENIEANAYEPQISDNTGVILEKQITLLQNIVGFDCANDASTSSYHSLGNSVGRDSPVSVFSSKLEDSTNLVFPNDLDLESEADRRNKVEDFLKPPQIEDISEDSLNLRNSEEVKSRKVLNRDEELFLECCSLLKSGSEVSNFSKKSNKNSLLNNASIKMAEEPDVLESKHVIYKVAEDSSDYSRRATPLGDSFGDSSNSNTISSSWEMIKNDMAQRNQENPFNFGVNEKNSTTNERSFCSSKFTDLVCTDAAKSFPAKNRQPTSDIKKPHKGDEMSNNPSSKMPTKGALKVFEGLKISIPTDELNLEMLKKKPGAKKTECNVSQKSPSEKQFSSPKTPRRKSKPVKNKPQIDDRFIFKVNKKHSLNTEETNSNISKESVNDKIPDVYDFEETQDNTEVFAKPDFKSFRTKGSEPVKGEIILENNYEIQTMSSSSSSTLSGKKSNECITKKKHMIMGRIFKNAVKPKLDEEIRDIPPIDHNELVENYVMSCTPKREEDFKKPKMTEEEMNYLFDKLLDRPLEQSKKSGGSNKTDCKNTAMRKKMKMKSKKRQRSNSDSTDDEFGLNKMVKKRPNRKNAKEEDNSINLEQELKECIGVASRKSQRKCTSGKQNVLVEYWSSDESAFETFLENHLQELSEKSDIPTPKEAVDKPETEMESPVPKETIPKISTSEKTKKPRSKHKVLSKRKESKEPSTSSGASETSAQTNRRKRTAAHPLYHWSSSSEDELQDLIEVKSIRDDPEDEYDEERPVQHGWIVGDSPKKLVTMLAQAKGKKPEPESFVKEQGKKKSSNS